MFVYPHTPLIAGSPHGLHLRFHMILTSCLVNSTDQLVSPLFSIEFWKSLWKLVQISLCEIICKVCLIGLSKNGNFLLEGSKCDRNTSLDSKKLNKVFIAFLWFCSRSSCNRYNNHINNDKDDHTTTNSAHLNTRENKEHNEGQSTKQTSILGWRGKENNTGEPQNMDEKSKDKANMS
jgi:hypothetical protein